MRWLLDQGLGRSTAFLLCQAGHDAVHVGDIGMAAATDAEILRVASEQNRTIVTFDSDFHALLALQNVARPSIVRIREEGWKSERVFHFLQQLAQICPNELENGCLISYSNNRIRIRKLPLEFF